MSNLLNILIVEDEMLIAAMLEDMLVNLNHTVIAKAKSFDETINALKVHKNINFVFLDINLSAKKSGLDVAKLLNEKYKIPFLFLTSYSDSKTLQSAIVFKPEAYLLKPFTKSDIFVTLELFKSRNLIEEKSIEIKDGHFNFILQHTDILWIKSESNYIEVKTNTKTHVLRNSLENFLEQLNDENFIKTHRSYVVNLQHIKAVNRLYVIVNEHKLPISRKHHEALIEKFSEKFSE